MVSDIQPILDDEFQAFLDYERDIVTAPVDVLHRHAAALIRSLFDPEYPHDITENFWYYQPQGPPFDDDAWPSGRSVGARVGKLLETLWTMRSSVSMAKSYGETCQERTAVEWGITEARHKKAGSAGSTAILS